MAPSPDPSKLFDPFSSLKYVVDAAEITLWYSGLRGPPTGKQLRSLGKIRQLSEGVRFVGSTLVSLWGRRDHAAARWRRAMVQHLRRRTGQLETEVAILLRQLETSLGGETVPPRVYQLWESIAALLPAVRQQVGARPPRETPPHVPELTSSLSHMLDEVSVRNNHAGSSLTEQLAEITRWVNGGGAGEFAPEIARAWARAIAADWLTIWIGKAGKVRRAIPRNPPVSKETMILHVLPEVVRQARQPQRVRVDRHYYRRTSRLSEDSRDILISPRRDLPTELLILWVKNQAIRAAVAESQMLTDPQLLVDAPGFEAYDTDKGEGDVARRITEDWCASSTKDDENDQAPLDEELHDSPDNSLMVAMALAPYYQFLSRAPAQQLLLRAWADLPEKERTLREAARRRGISYENARVQWGKLWRTLEGHGLKRPVLRRRSPLSD